MSSTRVVALVVFCTLIKFGNGDPWTEAAHSTNSSVNKNSGNSHILVRGAAHTLGIYLQGMIDKELGVGVLEQSIARASVVELASVHHNASILAGAINNKLLKATHRLDRLYQSVNQALASDAVAAATPSLLRSTKMHDLASLSFLPSFIQCCDLFPVQLKLSRRFGTVVNPDFFCDASGPKRLQSFWSHLPSNARPVQYSSESMDVDTKDAGVTQITESSRSKKRHKADLHPRFPSSRKLEDPDGNRLSGLAASHGLDDLTTQIHTSNITSSFKQNLADKDGIRWQYLLSVSGRELFYPAWSTMARMCTKESIDHSKALLRTLYPNKKLIILLDVGEAMLSVPFYLAQQVVNYILSLLTVGEDDFAVLLLDDEVRPLPQFPECHQDEEPRLLKTSTPLLSRISVSLNRIKVSSSQTDFKQGIMTGHKLLGQSKDGQPAQILVITSGQLDLNKLKAIVGDETPPTSSISSSFPLSLVTIESNRPDPVQSVQWEAHLQAANPHFSQLIQIHSNSSLYQQKAQFFVGLSLSTVGEAAAPQLGVDNDRVAKPILHYPSRDKIRGTPVISLTRLISTAVNGTPDGALGVPLAVVGLDISLAYLVSAVDDHPREGVHKDSSYVMLVHLPSRSVISHPRLPVAERLLTANQLPTIDMVESDPGLEEALSRMDTAVSGSYASLQSDTDHSSVVHYQWHKLGDGLMLLNGADQYAVVTVRRGPESNADETVDSQPSNRILMTTRRSHGKSGGSLSYQFHNMIRSGTSKMCRHLREVATMQTASLYLAPSAFAASDDNIDEWNADEFGAGTTVGQELRGGGTGSAKGGEEPGVQRAQTYLAYLTDPTRLIANPGLRPGVRSEIDLVDQVIEQWRGQAYSSPFNNYIVRRRVGTPRGAVLTYPGGSGMPDNVLNGVGDLPSYGGSDEPGGSVLPSAKYDPRREPWYAQAVSAIHSNTEVGPASMQLYFGIPQLDRAGAGFVVTVSRPILTTSTAKSFNWTNHQEHKDHDAYRPDLVAMLSADLTQSYITKMVLDTMPTGLCARPAQRGARCFLMNWRGYLVSHPEINGAAAGHAGGKHITEIEPSVATDLLAHKNFIRKRMCRAPMTGKLLRYFSIDVTHPDVITNTRSIGGCVEYHLSVVPGTNLLLGLVTNNCNHTSTPFCWCSTIDRSCLDCRHVEEGECECPCECEQASSCSVRQGKWVQVDDEGADHPLPPICEDEEVAMMRQQGLLRNLRTGGHQYSSRRFIGSGRHTGHLPPCLHTDCAGRTSEPNCFGVIGCAWCSRDQDGVTGLQYPFCTYQDECFGGILGAPGPYSRQWWDRSVKMAADGAMSADDRRFVFRASPIGPVAGSIMAFFFLLAITAWGYRKCYSGDHARGFLGLRPRGRGSTLRINTIEDDQTGADDGCHPDQEPPGGYRARQQQTGAAGILAVAADSGPVPADCAMVVSPYRMNPGYRRPLGNTTDSDHGYSTMTNGCGDQDSEVMSAFGVSDHHNGSRKERLRSYTANMGLHSVVTSGTSSRTSTPSQEDKQELCVLGVQPSDTQDNIEDKQLLSDKDRMLPAGTTQLKKNQFLVAVTVHMADT